MADITSNLVAHWKLDEPSGTSAADSSGNGYTGTYTNSPTLNVAGAFGTSKAVTFASASSQYGDVPHNAAFSTASWTIACWIKPTTWTSGAGLDTLLSKSSSSFPFAPWELRKTTSATTVEINIGAGGSSATAVGSSLTAGTWAHVAATWDGTTLRIYNNGSQTATSTATSGSAFTNSANISIGRSTQFGRYFNGTIDDVRIYSRALSAADVAALYAYSGFLPFILDDCE